MPQSFDDRLSLNGWKVKSLAPRQNRDWNLFRIGRAKNEFDVRGWLFQRLQQSIEGGHRQHVHFVNDIDLVTAATGSHVGIGSQLANLVDPAITRSIDFQNINVFAIRNTIANVTLAARFDRGTGLTIQTLGKNSGRRCLADTPSTREQIGVPDAVLLDRISQCSRNLRLSDQVIEVGWAVSQCDDTILAIVGFSVGWFSVHGRILTVPGARRE